MPRPGPANARIKIEFVAPDAEAKGKISIL